MAGSPARRARRPLAGSAALLGEATGSVEAMDPAPAPAPDGALSPGARRARRGLASRLSSAWALVFALVLAGLCVAALPFAPVERTTATVDWPVPGEPVESTMLTLLPYRPLELAVRVPCGAAAGGPQEPDERVLFSTFPVGQKDDRGLTVTRNAGGALRVVSEGTLVWSGRATGRCALGVEVVGERTRVLLADDAVADVQVEPPRVAALATSLPPDTEGLSVRLEADSRYESSPTLLKRVLLVLSLAAAALAVASMAALDRRRGTTASPMRAERSSSWRQDTAVAAVLAGWALLGPAMSDDGYIVAINQNFRETGYIGNYYHWYNAPEAPFALVHQMFVPLVELTRAPVVLRLPALLAGLTTWLLLSRVLLPRLGASWRLSTVRWVAVPVLLAWWIPFNNNLRPEPWVALAGTTVLALVLLASEQRRLLMLAGAGVAVGLSVAAAPTGLVAAAPFLVLAPRVFIMLRSTSVPWWLVTPVMLVPGLTVAGVAVFADQPLAAVLEATRVHQVIGPSPPWWQEIMRYEFLFGIGEMGFFGRRLVVLVAFLSLMTVLALRRSLAQRAAGLLLIAASCYGAALVMLVVAPSKWTHHFGGMAGFGVLLVVGLVVHGPAAMRSERAPARLAAVAALVTAGAAAAAFAGPNIWWAYGALGINPVLPGVFAEPLVWLAVGGIVVLALALLEGRSALHRLTLTALPATIVVLALSVSVLTILTTTARAAQELSGGWSMLSQNVGHVAGGDCGMGDHMEVFVPEPLRQLRGLGSERQSVEGAFAQGSGSLLTGPASLPADALRWGTLGSLPGDPNAATGTLTSAWFEVPPLAGEQSLGVVASGTTGGPNTIALEFADRDDPNRVLDRVPVGGGNYSGSWQQAAAALPRGAPGDLVRLIAADATTGLDGWLAVSQPVIITPIPLRDAVEARAIHVDWILQLAFPCLRQVPVAHGLAQLPDWVLTAFPRASAADVYGLSLNEDVGGAFAMARQASTPEVLPVRIGFVSEEDVLRGQDHGTLSIWTYPYPRDRFRLTLGTDTVWGATWGYRYPVPVVPEPLDLPGPRLVDKGSDAGLQIDSRPDR